jgi:hypothetical protein
MIDRILSSLFNWGTPQCIPMYVGCQPYRHLSHGAQMYFSIRLLFTCVSGGSPPYSPYTNHATLFLHAAHVALARLCGQCADAQLQAPRIRLRYVTVHGVAPSVVWPCESRLLDRSARVSVSVPTPTNSISGVSTHTSAVSASPRASAQCVLYWLFAAPFIGSTLGPHSPTQSFSIAPHTTRAGYYTHKHAHTHTSCTAIHSCRHAAHQHTPFFPTPYPLPSPPRPSSRPQPCSLPTSSCWASASRR